MNLACKCVFVDFKFLVDNFGMKPIIRHFPIYNPVGMIGKVYQFMLPEKQLTVLLPVLNRHSTNAALRV